MVTIVALVFSFLLFPFLVSAQGSYPAAEVSGGYQLVYNDGIEETLPAGFYGAINGNLNAWFGLEGEVGYSRKSLDTGLLVGGDLDVSLTTVQAGPRFTGRGNPQVVPFFHALFGLARASGGVDVIGVNVSDSASEFGMTVGGGVDAYFTDRVGVRLGGDYRRVFVDEAANEFRFLVGVVAKLGGD